MFFKILAFAFAVETGFLSGGVWNYSDRNVGWVDVGALYTSRLPTERTGMLM